MMIGQRLSHFEITAKLGEGGMGAVYRAVDTRLGREVAIKVLPAAFREDAQRLARFEREAKLLAALNHPHIAGLYEVGRTDGPEPVHFLVMELAEGETLAERLQRGPVPIDEALAIALEIAHALEAAHEKGVVHRDLKPANVTITAAGPVKVLDFGLAKAVHPESGTAAGDAAAEALLSASPTLTGEMTVPGAVLGTALYMSPEQARGERVDKRSDIWAWGSILYEMLTGRPPHGGRVAADVIASILSEEPQWDALPGALPSPIRRLLRRCLEKDPRRRLRDIGDAALEVESALREADSAPAVVPAAAAKPPAALWRAVPWLAAAAMAVALLVTLVQMQRSAPATGGRLLRLPLDLAPEEGLFTRLGPAAALSPDGRRICYVTGSLPDTRLQLRQLDRLEPTSLPNTEGAFNPFFSPDGLEIGFFVGDQLKKIPADGGTPVTVTAVPATPRSSKRSAGPLASWAADDSIVFSDPMAGPILKVPASGGVATAATRLVGDEILHRWPQALPGGDWVLFTAATRRGDFDNASIVAESQASGERRVLWEGGYGGRYLASGHLLFVHEGALLAVALDLASLETAGVPVRLFEQVLSSADSGSVQIAASQTGSLLVLEGQAARLPPVTAAWVERTGGEVTPLLSEPRQYYAPRLSPDGQRLATHIGGGWTFAQAAAADVWVYDLARDAHTRVTLDPAPDFMPIWTPDGERLIFSSERDGRPPNLFWKRADGSGEETRLTTSSLAQWPCSMTPDGSALVFIQQSPRGDFYDLWTLPLGREGPAGDPEPLLTSDFQAWRAEISPDGRWLAYSSNISGISQVYVQPFPEGDGRWQISTESEDYDNILARWSRTRPELYYRAGDRVMVVPYAVDGGSFRVERPRELFRGPFANRHWPDWEVTADGARFLMFQERDTTEQAATPYRTLLLLNWFPELERLTGQSR